MMKQGQKHFIKCRCVLPQFKRYVNPPAHMFAVFSVIDDDVVQKKFAQCPNCGIVHRVTDICTSEIIDGKEWMSSIVTIDDVKASLPEQLKTILETHDADLSTWENASFIYDNKQWGNFVVLASDVDGNVRQGKYVIILGENMFKIESFVRDEVITK